MKILITYAVEGERFQLNIENADIKYLYTGIGKVRAAMMLMKAICEDRPDVVINIGTAGTLNHHIGDIFVCHHFIDRDLEKVNLPEICYEIEFSGKMGIKAVDEADNIGICNTGDGFITEVIDFKGDVIDMESFAQADVCKEMKIPFVAVKYITDIIGNNSKDIWIDKLRDACEGLMKFFV